MNVFFDDWMGLADEDSSFGSKADNHLKVGKLWLFHSHFNLELFF
jgi:hypothetical protein